MELVNEDVFNSVNFCSNVARGDAGDFTDARCIHSFEKKENDLTVQGAQPLDEAHEPFQHETPIRIRFSVAAVCYRVQRIETERLPRLQAVCTNNM